ncbi:DNA-processing protein DprA [Gracilimonas mengyeensis]|uniref:DNA processing protein n=1 Tax=Gracilimonas mengyeensis TaxID=1302730 RepID=A0A521B8R9_9BACT|nr:DNA-processing protein DprA [Gracilimonas mengyeensis]SMO43463.1 DNA processing protein [Gracilimonas mengyeensis]
MTEKTTKKRRVLIALSLIPGFGCRRVLNLLKQVEDPAEIFHLGKRKLRSIEGIGEASALSLLSFDGWDEVDEILAKTEQVGAQIITLADENYPPLLKQIYDPPILLWIKGNPEALSKPGVAVVGTRNTSAYGRNMAQKFSEALVNQGLCVYSGLAYGIDAIAHKSALSKNGATVAVLGSGIDWIYPAKHKPLTQQIVESGGAVITEFPPGAKPDAGNFPVRNRVVSGLSHGVLVIESGIKGGSMITADLGLDQNREVFAVPHPLGNPSGTGCNYLIKRGAAKLVQTPDDIFEELPMEWANRAEESIPKETQKKSWREAELDADAQKICKVLEGKPWQVDALSEEVGMQTSQLLVALLQLEMEGIVLQKAGKVFELK